MDSSYFDVKILSLHLFVSVTSLFQCSYDSFITSYILPFHFAIVEYLFPSIPWPNLSILLPPLQAFGYVYSYYSDSLASYRGRCSCSLCNTSGFSNLPFNPHPHPTALAWNRFDSVFAVQLTLPRTDLASTFHYLPSLHLPPVYQSLANRALAIHKVFEDEFFNVAC